MTQKKALGVFEVIRLDMRYDGDYWPFMGSKYIL